jgi:hypothetical protein
MSGAETVYAIHLPSAEIDVLPTRLILIIDSGVQPFEPSCEKAGRVMRSARPKRTIELDIRRAMMISFPMGLLRAEVNVPKGCEEAN